MTEISKDIPIVFPIHPRTRKMADEMDLSHYFSSGGKVKGVWITEPLGYLEFLHLNMNARMVLTDSGGLQEETTVLGVPCITLRKNTERPITCDIGTNTLVPFEKKAIRHLLNEIENNNYKKGLIPELWDGKATDRIVEIIAES